jgi:hypothetical protein
MLEAVFSQEVGLSFLIFLLFFITFYVGSVSKYGSRTGTEVHTGSGSTKAKSYGSCGSGSGSTRQH